MQSTSSVSMKKNRNGAIREGEVRTAAFIIAKGPNFTDLIDSSGRQRQLCFKAEEVEAGGGEVIKGVSVCLLCQGRDPLLLTIAAHSPLPHSQFTVVQVRLLGTQTSPSPTVFTSRTQ